MISSIQKEFSFLYDFSKGEFLLKSMMFFTPLTQMAKRKNMNVFPFSALKLMAKLIWLLRTIYRIMLGIEKHIFLPITPNRMICVCVQSTLFRSGKTPKKHIIKTCNLKGYYNEHLCYWRHAWRYWQIQ